MISCDDLIFHLVLSPFDLNLNSKQRGSREVFDELIHLQLCSPKSQTWHSLFFSIAKGFKILTSFLPSPKMGVIVQSVFEFQKGLHFLVVAKMPKPFLEIEEYCKDYFAYFCAFKFFVIFSEKPPNHFLLYSNRKGHSRGVFFFFLCPCCKPSPPGPFSPSQARAQLRRGTREQRQPLDQIQALPLIVFPAYTEVPSSSSLTREFGQSR